VLQIVAPTLCEGTYIAFHPQALHRPRPAFRWRGATAVSPVTVVDIFFLGALLKFLLDSGGCIQILAVLGFDASLTLAIALRSNPGAPNNSRSVPA